MSAKAIREYEGKSILARHLISGQVNVASRIAQVKLETQDYDILGQLNRIFGELENEKSWLLQEKLVVKPDMLIKRRGKSGLLMLNVDWTAAKEWIKEKAGKEITVRKYLKS